MPIFRTEGIFPNDTINLRAMMLWPNSADRRRQYYAADYANGFVYEHDATAIYPWRASLIQALLEAPSWDDLKQESARCTRRAIVAGYVFTFMFLMDKMKDRLPPRGAKGASIAKAIFLAAKWGQQGATYGDGTTMYTSEKMVEECWKSYRDVAHFWAAMEMNRIAPIAPPREILHPNNFQGFMRAAAYMQMFGTTYVPDNRSKASPEFLLSLESAWLVDTDQYRPAITFTDDLTVFDDAPFMVFLKSYKAPKRPTPKR